MSCGMSSLGIAFVKGIVSLRDDDGSVGVLTSIEIFCNCQQDIRFIGYRKASLRYRLGPSNNSATR
jgi:hypothetical protein